MVSIHQRHFFPVAPSGAILFVGEKYFKVCVVLTVGKKDLFVGTVFTVREKPDSFVVPGFRAIVFVSLIYDKIGFIFGVDNENLYVSPVGILDGIDFLCLRINADIKNIKNDVRNILKFILILF